jgi:hypothetical protein
VDKAITEIIDGVTFEDLVRQVQRQKSAPDYNI